MQRLLRFGFGLLGACVLCVSLLVGSMQQSARAAGKLSYHYQRGYYLNHGWLCYGWPNGAYHCTAHWHYVHGRPVSLHPAWVPVAASARVSRPASAPVRSAVSAVPSGSVANMIRQVFGPYAQQALNVATCESGLNPNAKSPISTASGVFQFLSSTWAITPYHAYSPFNASANIRAAYWLFSRDGHTWREWSCGYRA
jgi:hypothetical protein